MLQDGAGGSARVARGAVPTSLLPGNRRAPTDLLAVLRYLPGVEGRFLRTAAYLLVSTGTYVST